MREQFRTVARIAGAQHGVVTYEQLVGAGVSPQSVGRWAAKGLLHREHRGVYRFGHRARSNDAAYLAAVLACGPGAVLSGLAAAHLYGLVRHVAPAEVTTGADRRQATTRRKVHPLDATVYRGIPVLTIPALLVDLAATVSLEELARAAHEADVRHGVLPEAIEAAAARRPGSTGIANLRAVASGDHALLLSRLEREFRARLREAGLPLPRTNRKEGAHYVDCRWPDHRLTVELDSFRFHRTRKAWEDDHERRRAARARGDEFHRYTWRDVAEQPGPMLADLTVLLSRGGRS
jgi:very-short-patch-repair endonuclease